MDPLLRSKTDDVVIQLRLLVERDLLPTFYLKIHVVLEIPVKYKKIHIISGFLFHKKILFFVKLKITNFSGYNTTFAFI